MMCRLLLNLKGVGVLKIEFPEKWKLKNFPANPAISPASMWTRKDMVDFKNAIRKEGGEGVIKVGHGETVTVSKTFTLLYKNLSPVFKPKNVPLLANNILL